MVDYQISVMKMVEQGVDFSFENSKSSRHLGGGLELNFTFEEKVHPNNFLAHNRYRNMPHILWKSEGE